MQPDNSQPLDFPRANAAGTGTGPQTTGRWVVTLADENGEAPAAAFRGAGLTNVASSRDFTEQAVDVDQVAGSDGIVFSELGVAVVSAEPGRMAGIRAASGGAILAIEPEYVHHILQAPSVDYLSGYRDAVSDLSSRLTGSGHPTISRAGISLTFADNDQLTWGLQATRVDTSPFTGAGIKVCVLDTGFTFDHPDFAGRNITSKSFITGVPTAEDGHGHGTHCIGTSCGPQFPTTGVRRYGCAYEADIYVGKVLSDEGSGDDTGILAGINWAVANRTQVISMSLGADVQQVSRAYERVGKRALYRNCLIIAAAGNNADRASGNFGFVGIPANSPSIMAVAALDEQLNIAPFSARSLSGVVGGNVDIAGPGVRVFSSWNRERPEQGNRKYRSISGTSMATPHVSGIAALWAQAGNLTSRDLWAQLTQSALRLELPSVDVGTGIVQAPQEAPQT